MTYANLKEQRSFVSLLLLRIERVQTTRNLWPCCVIPLFLSGDRPHRMMWNTYNHFQSLYYNLKAVPDASKGQNQKKSLTRKVLSHDPEQNAVPSGDTLTVLTRFSWPKRIATLVPFRTSQTLMV